MLSLILNKTKKLNYWLSFFTIFTVLFTVIPILIVLYFSFTGLTTNFNKTIEVVNSSIVISIFRSLYIAIVASFFIILLSYPTAYLFSSVKSVFWKSTLIFLITSPLWSTFFIKLIGLKSFFDLWNGNLNSTYGIIYTIIGLIYIYLPIAIVIFFNALNSFPSNLINAASDLGSTTIESLWKVIIPYTKESIISSLVLVFLPCFTTATISGFLNLSPNSKMIGELMQSFVSSNTSATTSRERISFLTFFISFLVFTFYSIFKFFPKLLLFLKNKS